MPFLPTANINCTRKHQEIERKKEKKKGKGRRERVSSEFRNLFLSSS